MTDKRILILDDNLLILEVVTEALIYENFEVRSISFGHQFFDAVNEFMPDLILLDYRLADTNGGDLCSQMKNNPIYKHIPVIIFSAYFHPSDIDKPGGCDGVLYKPFDLDNLLTTVHHYLERLPVKENI